MANQIDFLCFIILLIFIQVIFSTANNKNNDEKSTPIYPNEAYLMKDIRRTNFYLLNYFQSSQELTLTTKLFESHCAIIDTIKTRKSIKSMFNSVKTENRYFCYSQSIRKIRQAYLAFQHMMIKYFSPLVKISAAISFLHEGINDPMDFAIHKMKIPIGELWDDYWNQERDYLTKVATTIDPHYFYNQNLSKITTKLRNHYSLIKESFTLCIKTTQYPENTDEL